MIEICPIACIKMPNMIYTSSTWIFPITNVEPLLDLEDLIEYVDNHMPHFKKQNIVYILQAQLWKHDT
jgi:hypothetical protein